MKLHIAVALCVGSAALLGVVPATEVRAAGSWHCDHAPVQNFWEDVVGGNELSGRGVMCSTPWNTVAELRVRGLTPGNAYTVWWVYIDRPDLCANFPLTPEVAPIPADEPVGYADGCGLADFFTPDPVAVDEQGNPILNPLVVFGRMDEIVPWDQRRVIFKDDLSGFSPSPGSQIWLFVVGHGPADDADSRHRARQLLTPEDPMSGTPHVGISGQPNGYPAAVAVFRVP